MSAGQKVASIFINKVLYFFLIQMFDVQSIFFLKVLNFWRALLYSVPTPETTIHLFNHLRGWGGNCGKAFTNPFSPDQSNKYRRNEGRLCFAPRQTSPISDAGCLLDSLHSFSLGKKNINQRETKELTNCREKKNF